MIEAKGVAGKKFREGRTHFGGGGAEPPKISNFGQIIRVPLVNFFGTQDFRGGGAPPSPPPSATPLIEAEHWSTAGRLGSDDGRDGLLWDRLRSFLRPLPSHLQQVSQSLWIPTQLWRWHCHLARLTRPPGPKTLSPPLLAVLSAMPWQSRRLPFL